jgi:hypothetical protein
VVNKPRQHLCTIPGTQRPTSVPPTATIASDFDFEIPVVERRARHAIKKLVDDVPFPDRLAVLPDDLHFFATQNT